MKKVLITGGSGFIGYHLTRRLCQNDVAVRCLVRQSSSLSLLKPFDVEFCTGELDDVECLCRALDGCDTVFHVAGLVRAMNRQEFEKVNCFGTENLAKAAARCASPPVFIYISSLAAAGSSLPELPKREHEPPMPASLYGKSKLAGEEALRAFGDRMPCTIVRPGIVFGGADKMNFELFKVIKNWGFYPNPGYIDKLYSWIHADDLCDLLMTIAQNGERLIPDQPLGTGIYFASADEGRKWSEICRLIGQSLGRDKVRAVNCGPIGLWVLSTFYEAKKRWSGKAQPLDWEKARESLLHWTCSPEKVKTQFGFSPQPLEERIRQTTQWFVEHGWFG